MLNLPPPKTGQLLYNRYNTKLSLKADERAPRAGHYANKNILFMAGIQFQHGNNSWKFPTTSTVWYNSLVVTFQMIARISFTNTQLNHYIMLGAVMEKKLPISHQWVHQNQVISLARTKKYTMKGEVRLS